MSKKKYIILFVFFTFILTSCNSNNEENCSGKCSASQYDKYKEEKYFYENV